MRQRFMPPPAPQAACSSAAGTTRVLLAREGFVCTMSGRGNYILGATLPTMDFDFNKDLEELKHPTEYSEEPGEEPCDEDGEPV